MGIPKGMLYTDEVDALRLFEVGIKCEPPIDVEGIAMSHSLVNSSPLLVGATDRAERRKLAKYVYGVSRSLIGNSLADELRYPDVQTVGRLALFRAQTRWHRAVARWLPMYARHTTLTDFVRMMDVSAYDEGGIGYHMPQHEHAEKSGKMVSVRLAAAMKG